MATMWKLFTGDVRRLTSNVVSILIVIGIVVLPGLFAWFNIAASWDPFGNTSNLKFAVANVDAGYKSNLIPVKINVGDQIVSELHANSKLDWTFTSRDEAIDGTKSGKYYAAVIIPNDFSKHMMTFFSGDVQHAKLTYYTNQKKNALAPKVTGQGADQVAAQVNEMFSKTITSTALAIASQLAEQLNTPQAQQQLGNFSANIGQLANQLDDTSSTLGTYQALISGAQGLLTSSDQLISSASGSATAARKQLKSGQGGITDLTGAVDAASSTLSGALDNSGNSFTAVGSNIDTTFNNAGKTAADISSGLRRQATLVQTQIDKYSEISTTVQNLAGDTNLPQEARDVLNRIGNRLATIIGELSALRDALNTAAGNVDSKTADANAQHQDIKNLAAQAAGDVGNLSSDVTTSLKPQIASITASLTNVSTMLNSNADDLSSALSTLKGTSASASSDLGTVSEVISSSASQLSNASAKLRNFNKDLTDALNSGDMAKIKKVLAGNTDSLASMLASPVQLQRHVIYPVENFGEAMTPFYTFIPLWVGSLLLVLMLKTTVSRKIRRTLGDPKPHQLFLGHFGIFALLSLAQSTFSCAGTLLFLRVHAAHPWLFMLNGWVSGLAFAFIIYTLTVSFGTIGKAIAVIILVMQISGSGGAYPLQVVPHPIQAISPFLPATHATYAARAALAGIYMNDYWKELGIVLLFVLPMLLLGLLLRKPLVRFNRRYVARLESTKLL